MKKFPLLFLIFFLKLLNVNSVYFLFTKGSQKCFYEEFYRDNIITLLYNTLEDFHEMEMVEHEHEAIFNILLTNLETGKEDEFQGVNPNGKVKFIIDKTAPYSVCVTPRQDAKIFDHLETIKVSISLETIEENSNDKDLTNIPKSKDLQTINDKVDKLHKKIIDIIKTQHYQITKEDEFLDKHVANSSIIIYLTVSQICILFILTIWQISSFKSLFKENLSNII